MADNTCFTCGAKFNWQPFGANTQMKCARCAQAQEISRNQESAARAQVRAAERQAEAAEQQAKAAERRDRERAASAERHRQAAIEAETNEKELQKRRFDFLHHKCPACAEMIKREAKICRYCKTPVPSDVVDKNIESYNSLAKIHDGEPWEAEEFISSLQKVSVLGLACRAEFSKNNDPIAGLRRCIELEARLRKLKNITHGLEALTAERTALKGIFEEKAGVGSITQQEQRLAQMKSAIPRMKAIDLEFKALSATATESPPKFSVMLDVMYSLQKEYLECKDLGITHKALLKKRDTEAAEELQRQEAARLEKEECERKAAIKRKKKEAADQIWQWRSAHLKTVKRRLEWSQVVFPLAVFSPIVLIVGIFAADWEPVPVVGMIIIVAFIASWVKTNVGELKSDVLTLTDEPNYPHNPPPIGSAQIRIVLNMKMFSMGKNWDVQIDDEFVGHVKPNSPLLVDLSHGEHKVSVKTLGQEYWQTICFPENPRLQSYSIRNHWGTPTYWLD